MFCTFLTYICGFILLVLVGFKLFIQLRTKWSNSYTCLIGKTVIVTGANTGIGYFTALDFAKRGARVILACRNDSRAQEARKKIIAATGNANVVVKLVDHTRFQSVRDFCKDVNENEERLDILVNNAGIIGSVDDFTTDGLQVTWQVNHLSPFLLTILLLGKLKKSAPSRIVNVASMAAKTSKLGIETYPDAKHVSITKVYGCTKQANILFSRVLSERLSGSDVTVHSLHPGIIATEIFKGIPAIIKRPAYFLFRLFFKTPEEGAQTTIYCAVSKELENVSGKFYDECHEIPHYESCLDMELAERLWKKCEELVHMTEHEKME